MSLIKVERDLFVDGFLSVAISNDYEYREYVDGDILITHHLRNGEMIGQALYFNETADSQYWLDPVIAAEVAT